MQQLNFNQNLQFYVSAEFILSKDGKLVHPNKIVSASRIDCNHGSIYVFENTVKIVSRIANCRVYAGNYIQNLLIKLRDTFPDCVPLFQPIFRTNDKKICRAGSEIYLSIYGGSKYINAKTDLITFLDAIVGNTAVLLDRTPKSRPGALRNIAGNFEVNNGVGIYKTLSNFWLSSYPMSSLILGLTRLAFQMTEQNGSNSQEYLNELNKLVPRENIVKAIEENDFNLAYENFDRLTPLILDAAGNHTDSYPINKTNIRDFNYFIKQGIHKWVKHNHFKDWISGGQNGFENFARAIVHKDLADEDKKIQTKEYAGISMVQSL